MANPEKHQQAAGLPTQVRLAAAAASDKQAGNLVVAKVGPDRGRIRDYLAGLDQTTAYRGVTGAISFLSTGDPMGRSLVVTRVTGGELVPQGAP